MTWISFLTFPIFRQKNLFHGIRNTSCYFDYSKDSDVEMHEFNEDKNDKTMNWAKSSNVKCIKHLLAFTLIVSIFIYIIRLNNWGWCGLNEVIIYIVFQLFFFLSFSFWRLALSHRSNAIINKSKVHGKVKKCVSKLNQYPANRQKCMAVILRIRTC